MLDVVLLCVSSSSTFPFSLCMGVCFIVVLQVLIFSQMTSILDLLMDYCYLRGFQYSRLDGTMSYADREENVSVQT